MERALGQEAVDDEGFPRPFGSYLLLGSYGRGGMGEVYVAKTGGIAGIEKFCVLKKLRPDLVADEDYVKRFIDEARIVVTLNHSNIAQVFDVGRVGRDHYLAMEHISGLNLRQIADRAKQRETPISLDVALQISAEMLEGLDYAHRRRHPTTGQPLNLVHRDVSPHNVMTSFEGEVKIIDFGLAASELKVEQTESAVVMGKVGYMSPEQARGDKVDGRTDQFAAAIIVYELAAAERYYADMATHEIWQVVGNGGFVPRRMDALDAGLQTVLRRALAPTAEERYASCGDFKEALMQFAAERSPGLSRRPVRALLETLCSDDMESDRAFLARFSHVSAAKVREETEATSRQAVRLVNASPIESTTSSSKSTPSSSSFASPPSTSSSSSSPSSSSGSASASASASIATAATGAVAPTASPFGYDAPTEATVTSSKARRPALMVQPPPAPVARAGAGRLAAAAALASVVAIAVVFVTSGRNGGQGGDGAPTIPAPAAVVGVASGVPAPVVDAPTPPLPPVVVAPDPLAAPAIVAPPIVAPPIVAPPPVVAPTPPPAPVVVAPTPKKKPSTNAAAAATPQPVTPAAPVTPTPAAPTTPTPKAPVVTFDAKVARLQQCHDACAKPLTMDALRQHAKGSADEMRAFKSDVVACFATCFPGE